MGHSDAGRPADIPKSGVRELGASVRLRYRDSVALEGQREELERRREALEVGLRNDLEEFGADHPYVAVRRAHLARTLAALGDRHRGAEEAMEARRVAELLPERAPIRVGVSTLIAGLLDPP